MRVGLLHFGQSVDFVVSIAFLRSPVLAILAMIRVCLLWKLSLHSRAPFLRAASTTRSFTSAQDFGGRQPDSLSFSLHQPSSAPSFRLLIRSRRSAGGRCRCRRCSHLAPILCCVCRGALIFFRRLGRLRLIRSPRRRYIWIIVRLLLRKLHGLHLCCWIACRVRQFLSRSR
jgi:hypothetical protein